MSFDFDKILSILQKSNIVSQIVNVSIDEIEQRGIYKIRCKLIPSVYKLEIKVIRTKEVLTYSYQLYTDKPLLRWDNAPHFPNIKTYPHHFHDKTGNILISNLSGNIQNDLQVVLSDISKFIQNYL